MHSPILIKSSSCPVRGRQPLRKCSSFWILCYGITFTTALWPLRVQKDLVSHMVYCKFLSVDSFVSFYHASPSGYFLAFLEQENYTLSKQTLRTVYLKTVSETLIRVSGQSTSRQSVRPWLKHTFKCGEFQFCFDWIVTWLWNDIRIIITYFGMNSCARSYLVNFLCNITWYLGFLCLLPEYYWLKTLF